MLDVIAHAVEIVGLELRADFKLNVGGICWPVEEPPVGLFEQLVDLDSGRCFVHRGRSFGGKLELFETRLNTTGRTGMSESGSSCRNRPADSRTRSNAPITIQHI